MDNETDLANFEYIKDLIEKGALYDPCHEIKLTDIYSKHNPDQKNPRYIIAEPHNDSSDQSDKKYPDTIHTVIIPGRYRMTYKKYKYHRYILVVNNITNIVPGNDNDIDKIIINYVPSEENILRNYQPTRYGYMMSKILEKPNKYYFHFAYYYPEYKKSIIKKLHLDKTTIILLNLHGLYIKIYNEIKSIQLMFIMALSSNDDYLDSIESYYDRQKNIIFAKHSLEMLKIMYPILFIKNPSRDIFTAELFSKLEYVNYIISGIHKTNSPHIYIYIFHYKYDDEYYYVHYDRKHKIISHKTLEYYEKYF